MNEDLLAVGYLLIRPMPRGSFSSADLVPEQIISASECLCPHFPNVAAIDWSSTSAKQRAEKFADFRVAPERQPAAREWTTRVFGEQFGWPNTLFSLDAALQARSFIPPDVDVRAIGLALPATELDRFLVEATPPPPTEGYSPQGESGSFTTGKRRRALETGAELLGYEALNVEFGQVSHSWLCNGLETHCSTILGIRPNAAGLIETLEDARRCCQEISRAEVGAEPGPWFPFALVEYQLPAEARP